MWQLSGIKYQPDYIQVVQSGIVLRDGKSMPYYPYESLMPGLCIILADISQCNIAKDSPQKKTFPKDNASKSLKLLPMSSTTSPGCGES